MTRNFITCTTLLAIIFILSGLGYHLMSVWPDTSGAGAYWLLSAIIISITAFTSYRGHVLQLSKKYLSSIWLWMTLSLLTACSVLIFGNEKYAALRYFGEEVSIRSGLWILLFHAVFISVIPLRKSIGIRECFLVFISSCCLAFLLLRQPDFFSAVLLMLLCLFMAVKINNKYIRNGLLAAVGSILLMVISFVINTPYAFKRILMLLGLEVEPYGMGFEWQILSMATDQSGWFGYTGDLSSSAMVNLPSNLEWYPLSYTGLSFGISGVLLSLIAQLIFVTLIYRLSSTIVSDTHRVIVQSLLFVMTINLARVILGTYTLTLPSGHFGLPFISAGQMSVFAGFLLFITMCGLPNYIAKIKSNTTLEK